MNNCSLAFLMLDSFRHFQNTIISTAKSICHHCILIKGWRLKKKSGLWFATKSTLKPQFFSQGGVTPVECNCQVAPWVR